MCTKLQFILVFLVPRKALYKCNKLLLLLLYIGIETAYSGLPGFHNKTHPIELSVSPAPLSYCCSLGQTNELLTVLQWQLLCENLVPPCFCTILDTEGHQMGIKYSMEGFIKYLIINMVGILKRGFIDLNASGEVSYYVDKEDQHCSCIARYD